MLCFLMLPLISISQTLRFSYDQNGNRNSRLIIEEVKSSFPDSSLSHNKKHTPYKAIKEVSVNIFPNPTSDVINLHYNDYDEKSGLKIDLYTANGESLKTFIVDKPDQTVDLTNYSAGIYYLKIQMGNHIRSWKVIKIQ